ncbi:tetratricopeptide repeat protein [Prevotella sp. CAG:474]|nr:tetratricopeptide repeat protein [Prevotella sp. CAG:474]
MRKTLLFSLTAGSFLMMTSCSKMGPLSADNFTVTPKPLETQAGVVSATVNGAFPEKYMKKKAVVTVTPELRFGDGKVVKGEAATFQGEKVMGNDQVISYRMGGHYTMKTAFAYNPEMQKSDMYLTFDARRGKKVYNVPAVKVNYGIIATSELYRQALTNGGGCLALDSFQRVKAKKQEANIKFLINQANLRKSELKNNSVGEFVKLLKEINKDREGLNLQNVEIQAYASPEGGFKFNDKLANKRQNVSEKYVRKEMKSAGVEGNLDAHYTAQDWEGFQQLVQASNIQDKDVILRVLSMYKDPQEREQQIRNMSEGFRELADAILPELRRSRLIIHYETIGRNDEQIKAQYNEDAAKLSADELLYYATLEEDAAKKEEIYAKTAQLYTNDYRPLNNLAVMAFNRGDEAKAKELLAQAITKSNNAAEANATLGLIALKNGNVAEAENLIAKAADANALNEALGNLSIAKGNYAQAEEYFKDSYNNSAALAQLLNKNYAAAKATLNNIKNPNGLTSYLHAIVSARQGNKYAANSYLKEALQKDPSLKAYAENDLEFANMK